MASAILTGSVSEQIRRALLEAAAEGYEDAGIRGLCREGAWEAALSAIQSKDLGRFVVPAGPKGSPAESRPLRVRDAMTAEAGTLCPEDELSIADDVMRLGRVRHLPVVDASGTLRGIVSQRDLLRSALRREAEGALPSPARLRVSEVMTPDVIVAEANSPLAEAASLMFERKLGCLPVVEGGKLVGILTEADFVRMAFRSGGPQEHGDPNASCPPGDSVSAAAAAGLEAVALLERAASRCEQGGPPHFRRRAGAIASRSAALRSGLAETVGAASDGWELEAALDVATRCAQATTLAVEIHQADPEGLGRNTAAALRLAATAAECALDFSEAALLDLEDGDRVRSTRRRVWRSRLLLRRARLALRNSEPDSSRSAHTTSDRDLETSARTQP